MSNKPDDSDIGCGMWLVIIIITVLSGLAFEQLGTSPALGALIGFVTSFVGFLFLMAMSE